MCGRYDHPPYDEIEDEVTHTLVVDHFVDDAGGDQPFNAYVPPDQAEVPVSAYEH